MCQLLTVFGSFDLNNVDKHPDNDKMIELIKNKDLKRVFVIICVMFLKV